MIKIQPIRAKPRRTWTNESGELCLVAGEADTLEPVAQRDADPVVLTRHGETVVHQESVQHQTVLNINISDMYQISDIRYQISDI